MHDPLVQKIADKIRTESREPLRTMGAAIVVLRHFLGDTFIARKVRPSKSPDPFMLNDFNERSDNRFILMQRVCDLADYLFILRNVEGFDVLIERILNREIRAHFFEARSASIFKQANFIVKIRKEIGVRKEDFDFQAADNDNVINVEVTACTNEIYSTSNLENVLNNKRKQLPDTAPAALFCILPAAWFDNHPDLKFEILLTTNKCFSRKPK